MTNCEYWKERLLEIVESGGDVAIMGGVPVICESIDCRDCDRIGKCTEDGLVEWLCAERATVQKLTKKERMFCELAETGWIAREKNKSLYLFSSKPKKGNELWFGDSYLVNYHPSFNLKFDFIKWEDEYPWSVEDLLKLEVEE